MNLTMISLEDAILFKFEVNHNTSVSASSNQVKLVQTIQRN